MKYRYIFTFVLLPIMTFAQNFQFESGSIPVTVNEREVQDAFNGGYNLISIALADLDNDGDYDMLFNGSDENRLQYYRNVSLDNFPDFVIEDTWLSGISFSAVQNRLSLEDIDFDGDADLFVGETSGQIRFYRNEGGVTSPDYVEVTDFLDSIDVGNQAVPTFGDLNGDGLKDLIIGTYDSGFMYFQRQDSSSLRFTFIDTLRQGDGSVIKPGNIYHFPSLADIDGDDDLDLFGTSNESRMALYINTGTVGEPQFVLETDTYISFDNSRTFVTPVWLDYDFDFDIDLFIGGNEGFVDYYRNNGTVSEADIQLSREKLPLGYLDFGFYTIPYFLDIDDDGDEDLFAISGTGEFNYLQNVGTVFNAEFDLVQSPFQSNHGEVPLAPAWADLDGDDDYDLVYSRINGPLYLFENVGTPEAANYDSVGVLKDTNDVDILGRRPEFADIDQDGDNDLLTNLFSLPSQENLILMYENFGSADSFAYALVDTLRDTQGSVLSFFDMYFRLTDLENDDTLDLFVGNSDGIIEHFKNVGEEDDPVFELVDSEFGRISTGSNNRCIPFLTDIDGDNDLDVFAGRFMGGLQFYRNAPATSIDMIADAIPQDYVLEQNYPNPFNPVTYIRFYVPETGLVTLSVYNTLGQKVKDLVSGNLDAGQHMIALDGSDLASGIYFYHLSSGNTQLTKKMILLK